ncbi:MBL fold metallo-hydrolase [Desulfobotulus sp. H1]|uniref:MBL fold metallo-hydrolase n=1 Tax=Desulfobotulus pelophilus TaxID=2823377 RepID=A0ABT3N6V0_9BACT|nr:MBL fold metallo-hydrolase [Desulfobotulus pelophilus]MCW7753188.1 MBL fold metallo-hydrolase [Desulfobotulus pelophilus]
MTRITLLAENTTATGAALMGEHGLSFLMETPETSILFDTGQGMVLGANARTLGKDLSRVETIVLSHGHYDHTGGLVFFEAGEKNKRLVAHPAAFAPKWAGRGPGQLIPIGCPFTEEEIRNRGFLIETSTISLPLSTGIRTTGEIPMVTDWERVESYFFAGEPAQPDSMPDDMGLILESAMGTVLILGCTHRGIINTLTHVAGITGSRHFHAILGGLHLGQADEKRLNQVSSGLKDFSFDHMMIGHCTGIHAYGHLRRVFGERVTSLSVGSSWTFPGN